VRVVPDESRLAKLISWFVMHGDGSKNDVLRLKNQI